MEIFIQNKPRQWNKSTNIVLIEQTIHAHEILSNGWKSLHTKWHLSRPSNSGGNVRPHSVHSRTKVRLFATSLLIDKIY